MILEILLSLCLREFIHRLLRAFNDNPGSREQITSVDGELRELGRLEQFFHRNYVENGYFISSAAIVNSKSSIDDVKAEEALRILAKRHPLLQAAVLELNHREGASYYFTKMPLFKVEYGHSDQLATEPSHWEEAMSTALRSPFNVRHGPLWRCCRLKEHADLQTGKVTNCFVFSFHHAIMDGISRTMLFEEFLGILDRLHRNDVVENISYNLRPSCETLLGEKVGPFWWQRLKTFVIEQLFKKGLYSFKSNRIDMYFKQFPVVKKVDSSVKQESRAILTCLSKSETSTLVSACKQHSCSVNGAISAAANMALAEILQNGDVNKPQWIPSFFAVSNRRDISLLQPKNIDYLGTCVSEAELSIIVPPHNPQSLTSVFWNLSKDITCRVSKMIKSKAYLKETKLYQAASRALYQSGMHARVWSHHGGRYGDRIFFISNTGRFEGASEGMFGLEKIFLVYGNHKEGHLFDIFITTINGSMCFSFVYYPHVTARKQAEEFNTKFLNKLRVACVGHR